MNQARSEKLKSLRDQSENELEEASIDDIFKLEEPGPDAKILMGPDQEEKGVDVPLKSTEKNDIPGAERA